MAIVDVVTLTRSVTLAANALAAGQVTNTLTGPAFLRTVTSSNANVLVTCSCIDGVSATKLVRVGSVLTVTVLNTAASSQTATITVTGVQVADKYGSTVFL